jgi:hypothetical protein
MKRLILIALLLIASPAWADGTIDTLTAGAALGGTEQIPMFQTANPAVKTTPNAVSTFLASTTQTLTNKTLNCGGTGNVCTVRIANDVSGLGTGVATALGTNVGSAGAFVTFNGAGGTPGSLTLTNATGAVTATYNAASVTYAKIQNGVATALLQSNVGAAPSETTTGTGVITALGVNVGSAGAFTKNNGDALSGTFTGSPTFSGATLTFSGATPLLTGLSAGTQVSCLGLDSGNHIDLNAAACGSGSSTGVGVQGGQSVSNVGDNATALPSGHYYYATNANMTAQRTHALPDSATQAVGDFMVMDTQQTVTATNQLCMARAGTDTINGGTTAVCITAAGGSMLFHNDGAGHFTTGPLANISAPTDGQILVGKTGTPSNIVTPVTMSQDCTITNAGVITCLKTNNVSFGALATVTAGTGIATALAVNVGTAGAPVINGGALGTPSSGTGTNITAIPNANVLGVTTGSGTTHTMGGANGPREYWFCTGTCTVTMPAPAAGQEYCVATNVGVTAAITLAAIGSSAMYGKTDQSAYGTAGTGTAVSTSASANKICLVGLDSTHFNVASYNGTWTMN